LTETWLTPWASQAEVSATAPMARLYLGSAESPTWDVTVSASDFTNSPVQIGLAEIHPLDAGPLWARLNPKEDRYLSQVFALQAFDVLNRPVELAPARQLAIQIIDAGGTNPPPRLVWFDPTAGVWQVVANGCQRIDSNRLGVVVTRLTALHGLFEAGTAPYLAGASAAAPGLVLPRAIPAQSPPSESDYDTGYKRERARVRDRLNQIADILEGGSQIDPTQDAEVLEALEDMARRAQDYANAHPNESAKTKLLIVAQHAGLLGQTALEQPLMNQATEIANHLARQLLAEGDCGRVREMLHAMEQLMLMAGEQSLIDALKEKIDRLFAECDLWIGTVRFVSFTDGHHPGLQELTLQSGLFSWSELHEVKMATHAKTLALKGEDYLKLDFPRVKFQDPGSECEFSISFYGQPASAANFLNFDGTYDGVGFNVGQLSPAAGAKPVSVTQYEVIQVPDQDDNCVNAPGTPAEYPFPNYYSVLMHGFLDTPPITLQEMLDTGTRSGGPFGDVISGYEKVSNAYPAPNYGRYPFTTGLITWRFIHVKKLLPLEPGSGLRSR
jgi:hypothetical protein